MRVNRQTRPVLVFLHAVGTIAGGYILCACITALASTVLVLFGGQARGDAVLWTTMSSFLLYVVLLIWAFSTPPERVWTGLALGTVLSWGLCLYLDPILAAHLNSNTL